MSWRLVGAWAVTLLVTTFLTWNIVSAADSQVRESPVAIAPPTFSTGTDDTTTSTTGPTSSTSTLPGPTTSTPAGSSTTPSSSSTSSSTSSTVASAWSLRTVVTTGGTVVIRYRPNQVELQAATPTPGFAMDIEDSGPDRVRVEFENASSKIRVEARWEGSGLDVEVTEDD